MSILQCPIQGVAVVTEHYNDDGTMRRLEWAEIDEEIHVTKELLAEGDPEGLAFLEAKYELGEECSYDQRYIHARLRNGATT